MTEARGSKAAMNGVLPDRPLRLDESALKREDRKLYLLLSLLGLVGVGFGFGTYLFAAQHLEHLEVWRDGVPGTIVDIDGAVTESGPLGIRIFYDYKVNVRYLDQASRQQQADIEFSLFWSDADPDRPAELRYLARQPQRVTISSAVESGVLAHFGMPGLMALLSMVMLLGFGAAIREHGKRRRALETVVQDGEELAVEILDVTLYQGTYTVRFRLPEGDRIERTPMTTPPLSFVHNGATRGLVLRSPRDPDVWVLMRQDLSPLALSEEEKAAVRSRMVEAGD